MTDELPKFLAVSNHYASLAAGYNELTLYEEAEVIASRSLELDPRPRKARYSRAIARWKSGNLRGAVADIDTLYALGAQNFPGLKKTRKTLYQILERTGTTLLAGERDLSWPDIYTDPVQPTSDDHRPFKEIAPGQFRPGAPCWHHNIRECDGGGCPYSHTPDKNSIRDTNDRNVCLQFLLGNCQRERCYHSHSTSGLPEDVTIAPSRDSKFTLRLQWWNNPSRMVEIRQLLQDRQDRRKARYEAKPKAPGETRPGQTQNVDKPSPTSSTKNVRVKRAKEKPDPAHNQKPSSVVSTKVGCQGPTSQTSKKETKHANHDKPSESLKPKRETKRKPGYMSKTVKSLEKLTNCGLTDDDVVDLMGSGLNPWDEDAHSLFAHVDDY